MWSWVGTLVVARPPMLVDSHPLLKQARKNLDAVTNTMFATTKRNLTKKLEGKEKEAK